MTVRQQLLIENAKEVRLGKERYPVRRTPKRGLRQVDVEFEGEKIRGLEQNPEKVISVGCMNEQLLDSKPGGATRSNQPLSKAAHQGTDGV